MHNDVSGRGRGDGTREYRGQNPNSAPQWGSQYPHDHGSPVGEGPGAARRPIMVTVLISVLATLIVVVLAAGLLWWTFRDQSVEAAPGGEHFELTDIEVPGREAALEAQGEPVPAAAQGASQSGTAGQPTAPFPGALTSVPVAGGVEEVSSLPCDGRYVLITASILDNTPDPAGQISAALAIAPGDSMFLMPGACPSLRGFYQGGNVYPVLIDYGFDAAAVCEAAKHGGGNARILSDRFEYRSPC